MLYPRNGLFDVFWALFWAMLLIVRDIPKEGFSNAIDVGLRK
jgi:hypothetical protein